MTNTYWSRIPGTLSPSNVGDDVNLDTGDLICSNVVVGDDAVQLFEDRRLIVGNSVSSSATTTTGVDIRAESTNSNARLLVQGTSTVGSTATGYSLYKGPELVWAVRYSGSSFYRGTVEAPDLSLVSRDSSYYRSTDSGVEYSGPSLSLVKEITRLEGLVKELYERLRMTPETGWEVWDGNPDVVQSLGRCNSSQS